MSTQGMRRAANVLGVALGLAAPLAQSGTGDLDPAFANQGRRAIAELDGSIWAVEALGGAGIFVAGGDFDLRRLIGDENPRTPDIEVSASSFASFITASGDVDPATQAVIDDTHATAAARQPDGKVILAGTKVNLVFGRLIEFSLAVIRLNDNGALDSEFGAGGLFVWPGGENIRSHLATSLALEPDGRIIVAGTRTIVVGETSEKNLMVLRLLANGSMDESFGAGGVYIGPAVESSGQIRLARTETGGYRIPSFGSQGCIVVGLTANGAPDGAFGSAGMAMVASPDDDPVSCISLESLDDGRLIVAGRAGENGYVSRLLVNGASDPAFVADATIALSMYEATSVAAADDGKVLVAGTGSEGVSIVRLQANGESDGSFGDGGRTWIELESDWGSTPNVLDMHVTDDGEVIAGGGDVSTDQPFVVRLLGDSGGVSHGVVGFTESNICRAPGVKRAGGRSRAPHWRP